jgi:hypothetical protein
MVHRLRILGGTSWLAELFLAIRHQVTGVFFATSAPSVTTDWADPGQSSVRVLADVVGCRLS